MAPRKRGKTALVLAGGGIAGVSYEVGALRALDHILVNRTVNDFDIFVGTSAGAIVAASVASGIPPVMLAGLVAGTVPGFRTLGRREVYQPNFGELAQRLTKAPGLLAKAASEYWRFKNRMPLSELVYNLAPLVPSGFFHNSGVERYVRETFARAALSDDFRDVNKELHIIAADLETDRRVDFSRSSHPDVPISRAVAASTCIPVLFRPVEIDGRFYVDGGIKGQAAVDIAIERGATLIVVVNGLVPLDTRAIHKRATVDEVRSTIMDLGFRAVYNQVIRGMLHDSLIDHLKSVRLNHPGVDIVLIEPRPDDEKMFYHEVMSFSARLIVLQHGYETVTTGLQRTWPYLSRILPAHGIEVSRERISRKPAEMSIRDLERPTGMLGKLRHTVLDRRDETEVAEIRRPAPIRVAKPAARRAAVGGSEPASRPRSRGFKPRVITGDGPGA